MNATKQPSKKQTNQISNDEEYRKALIRLQNISEEIEMLGETAELNQEYAMLGLNIKEWEWKICNNKKFQKLE